LVCSTADGAATNRRPARSRSATLAIMLAFLLFCAAAMAGREAGATVLGETLGGDGVAGTTPEVVPGEGQQAPSETQRSAPAPAASQPDGGASGVAGGTLGTAEGVVGGAGEAAGTVVAPATGTVGRSVVQPVARTADPVLQPVGEATGVVLAEAEPVLQPVAEAVAPVVSPVRAAVEPIVEPVIEPVSHVTDPVVGAVNPDPAPSPPQAPPVTGPPDAPEVPAVDQPNPTPDNGGAVGRGEPGVVAAATGSPAADRTAPAVALGPDAGEAARGGSTAARVAADGLSAVASAGAGPSSATAERFAVEAGASRTLAEVFALPIDLAWKPAGLPFAGGLGERFLAAVAGTYAFGVEVPLSTVGDIVPSGAALEGVGSSFGIGFILCAALLFLFPRGGPAWFSSGVAARSAPPRPPGERPD
jgi:hypothetical protein